jgi:hypothetical protein
VPFTGSHPAAVLPLFRPLVPSALVIGSMVPDLGYYVPLPVSSPSMHTLPGVLGADLLAGLLCFVLWQVLVAPVVVAASPAGLRSRLGPDLPVPWRSYLRPRALALTVASLWVGAATHVGWDEFTHPRRFGPAHVTWLAERHGALPGYAWAQYASGVVGGVVLVTATLHYLRTTKPTGAQRVPALSRRAAVLGLAAVATATLAGGLYAARFGMIQNEPIRHTLFLIATWGGGTGLGALLIGCLAVRPLVTAP